MSLKHMNKAGVRAESNFPTADSGCPCFHDTVLSFQMEVLLIAKAFACRISGTLH